jgi:radical SAM-linked protein
MAPVGLLCPAKGCPWLTACRALIIDMALDSSQAAIPADPSPGAAPERDKVRIRFRKGGDLRLVSHHDLMQCFERMLRRAGLPFHATEGFNPKPRMVFALSLALGIVGCEEVLELELDARLAAQEIHERLARQAPAGLDILRVRRIDRKSKAQVRRACYRLPIPAQRGAGLPERLAALLAAPHCWIDRSQRREQALSAGGACSRDAPTRPLDIRPCLRDLRFSDGWLELDLWITPGGTARPEEVLALLGLSDLLVEGAVLERCTLELHDEVDATESAPEPVERTGQPAWARGPAPARPSALVPGPLSFDT